MLRGTMARTAILCVGLAAMLTANTACPTKPSLPDGDPPPTRPVVGDLSEPPAVTITDAGSGRIKGSANNLDTRTHQIVIWAKTDKWYVQPFIDSPYTAVGTDGRWESFTHPWNRILALLVDESYDPGATRTYHPSSDEGVLAWDEFPDASSDRFVLFAEYRWRVKTGDLAGPGPNYFSDDSENVFVDTGGSLHLRITFRDDRWYSGEVVLDEPLGYGTYSFIVAIRVDNIDPNVVAAGFIYGSEDQEIDIEFSQALTEDPENSQYVVQPYHIPGNIYAFKTPDAEVTSHRFHWQPDRIDFVSWEGNAPFPPDDDDVIARWEYTGKSVPDPIDAKMRFNLWLFGGDPPTVGEELEFIVSDFEFEEEP